jgi:hypothetical protein
MGDAQSDARAGVIPEDLAIHRRQGDARDSLVSLAPAHGVQSIARVQQRAAVLRLLQSAVVG